MAADYCNCSTYRNLSIILYCQKAVKDALKEYFREKDKEQ